MYLYNILTDIHAIRTYTYLQPYPVRCSQTLPRTTFFMLFITGDADFFAAGDAPFALAGEPRLDVDGDDMLSQFEKGRGSTTRKTPLS